MAARNTLSTTVVTMGSTGGKTKLDIQEKLISNGFRIQLAVLLNLYIKVNITDERSSLA